MSYDVDFCDPVSKKVIEIEDVHFMRGGTYQVGGSKQLSLNITYNYASNYGKHGFSIRDLDGKTAAEVIPELDRIIGLLSDETDPDYWKAVDGNAKRALIQLRVMAKMRPDAIIEVE